jgi:NADH:ubiquinone oxidoreductase subunit F (NADH-binding)
MSMPAKIDPEDDGVEPSIMRIREFVRAHGPPMDEPAVRLAEELGMPAATLRGVAGFYADLADDPGVRVCLGTSCLLAGSERVRRKLGEHEVPCRSVYCLGYCDRSPALLDSGGVMHLNEGAHGFAVGRESPGKRSLPDIRFRCDPPVVTRRLLDGGAATLEAARAQGAYRALTKALTDKPEDIIAAMERSGERGRGGAGYPTARKWKSCAETPAERRYVIANGDEGDPGSFIDRVLMEHDPHAILEGLALCAYAVGAREGIVFIRSEYPRAIEVMRAAIREATVAGVLGCKVLGHDFEFEVSVVTGMGSYVCGEETALLNAIEGKRGEVRLRPPFPTQCGLHGMPTVVNNVETLVNVPFIVADGGESYARLGSPGSKGTKALCLNHGFAKPGIVEIEFGLPLREVIEEIGGGGRDGKRLVAVLVGGPMGSVVTPDEWSVPVCYDAMRQRGIELGHGGLVAVPEDADFRALLEHWLRFMIDESCGKCVPCRLGSQCAANALHARRSPEETRRRLDELFTAMEQGSLCAFGQSMPRPMRQLIEHFGDRIF